MISFFKRDYYHDIIFIILFLIVTIISIDRIRYGFGGYDEAFYLTIPQRLSMGDAMFKDEWHLSQMSGWLLYPIYLLVKHIIGGTIGIMHAFRYVYLIAHGCISLFAYFRFRKYGIMAAIGCSLYFMFTPYNIMALCYNTMTLDFLVLTGVFLSTFDIKKPVYPIFAGLCFAAAVLCCPYLLAVYVIYGVATIANRICKRDTEGIFSLRTFIFFTLGAAILAVIFFGFVFSRVGFSDFVSNLKLMFADPEHADLSFGTKMGYYIWSIKTCHEYFSGVFIAYLVILAVMFFDKKRVSYKVAYFMASALITISCFVLFIPVLMGLYYNAIEIPLIFTGLSAYILCKEKPANIYYSIFISGILYSVCANFASNTGIFTIANALSVSTFASFLFIGKFLKEELADGIQKYIAIITTIVIVGFLAVLQYRVKTEYYFRESGRAREFLSVEMTDGPAKGIITSLEHASDYQIRYYDVTQFKSAYPDRDNLLVLSEKTWIYLMFSDYPYATFSDWISGENDVTLDRLKEYFEINPNKTPKYIYIPKDTSWDMDRVLDEAKANGYEVNETEYSWWMGK